MKRFLHAGLCLLTASCVATERPDTTLYEGARVLVGDGTVVEDGAILVEGSRILVVDRSADIVVPRGTRRVDLRGRTVIPALIDAHAHLGFQGPAGWGGENYTRANLLDHLDRYAYYGFGAVFTTGTDPSAIILPIQAEQARGEVGGARVVFAAGMAPPGQGPNPQMLTAVNSLAGVVLRGAATPEEGRTAVREIAGIPSAFIKIWVDDRNGAQEKMAPPVFEAIIAEAAEHGIAVVAHQQTVADMKDLLRAGVAGFLHGRLGPEIDDEVVAMLRARDAYLVPNIGLTERGQDRAFEDPFLRETLGPTALRTMAENHISRPPNSEQRERGLRDAMRRLLDGGIAIVLGTDAGALPDHHFGYTGHRELETFVRLGMSPMEAIVSATSRPAERLGLTDMGTLAPGKSADFVVLDANPLDDIRNTRRIVDVYLRGERVDREVMRERFAASAPGE